MAPDQVTVEYIVAQAARRNSRDRLRLIQRIIETLLSHPSARPGRPLVYGEFGGGRMSTEEDFKLAEWRPSDDELDGR